MALHTEEPAIRSQSKQLGEGTASQPTVIVPQRPSMLTEADLKTPTCTKVYLDEDSGDYVVQKTETNVEMFDESVLEQLEALKSGRDARKSMEISPRSELMAQDKRF